MTDEQFTSLLDVPLGIEGLDIKEQPILFEVWDSRWSGAMAYLNVRTWGDICGHSEGRLLWLDGFGRKRVNQMSKMLEARGLCYENTAPFSGRGKRPIPKEGRSASGVYFIRCNEFIKIGQARDVTKRFKGLSHANPYRLEMLAYWPCSPDKLRDVERALHIRFKALRCRGEWFKDSPEIRESVNAALSAMVAAHRESNAATIGVS